MSDTIPDTIWLTNVRKSLKTNEFAGPQDLKEGFALHCFGTARNSLILKRRDVGVVDRARLESVCRGNSTEGSNPSLSAIPSPWSDKFTSGKSFPSSFHIGSA